MDQIHATELFMDATDVRKYKKIEGEKQMFQNVAFWYRPHFSHLQWIQMLIYPLKAWRVQ